MFIHERPDWTNFTWDADKVAAVERKAIRALGFLAGRMSVIGFDTQLSARVESMTNDVVASSAIEGVALDTDEVRSSVARKFGISVPDFKDPTHYVDGIVEMMVDAIHNNRQPLDLERLFRWHWALFPNGRSGGVPIRAGEFREDEMSVVSGTLGRERIHYRAPSAAKVPEEMEKFLDWLNSDGDVSDLLKSAIAHLWFVSIHPFDDGNGRIARAISDMLLARLEGEGTHFYSLSRQILTERKHYYEVLEHTQRGEGDITAWLEWFLNAVIHAVDDSNTMLSQVLRKATFWNTHSQKSVTERQRKVLNIYLDGYDAKLTAKNWAKLAEVSSDTALRDINSLEEKGILKPTPGKVRDVAYSINYTEERESPFRDVRVVTEGKDHFIKASLASDPDLRERVLSNDFQRFESGEITLDSLAYKYFSYLLPEL